MFFTLAQISKKKFPDNFSKHYQHTEKLLRRAIIAPFLGDLSQNENSSEIKPPLSSEA
jgi:hypothetical protein